MSSGFSGVQVIKYQLVNTVFWNMLFGCIFLSQVSQRIICCRLDIFVCHLVVKTGSAKTKTSSF